jgi:REP element-mobilizing transposase RayT
MNMPRQVRNLGSTGWEHIILRGINRENLFYDEEDFARFLSTVSRFQRECPFEIAASCLMSNHVHLLMHTENGAHSQIIRRITVSYASYYNRKYDRVGHVFQDRFRSEPVENDRYLLTVARYIYMNPQKAGICAAAQYPYTFVQTDGILSGYFNSPEELSDFLNTESNDRCLEFDSTSGYTDAEALELLASVTGSTNPQSLQGFDKTRRDEMLRRLKTAGLTVRQISRLTGINRNTVQRV